LQGPRFGAAFTVGSRNKRTGISHEREGGARQAGKMPANLGKATVCAYI